MSKDDNGGMAFPSECFEAQLRHPGMSLRDYFAGQALVAEMITTCSDATPQAAESLCQAAADADETIEQHLAFNAYKMADAMLEARKK